MKRIQLLAFALMVISLQMYAIRALRMAFPYVQKDGTTLMAYKNGDGHLAFYTTEDNYVVVANADGNLCYALLNANERLVASGVVAHNQGERSAEEQAYVSEKALRPDVAAVRRKAMRRASPRRRACIASTDDGLGKYGQSGMGAVESIGNYTIPVIMVEFQDTKFQPFTTKEKMTRYYNEEGYADEALCVGSVRDYFKSQSRGMFVPNFEIVAKVALDNGYAYYGKNDNDWKSPYYGYDLGLSEDNYFVKEAVEKAVKAGVDFTKYEKDGSVPLVSILYAGQGEATADLSGTDYLWPCEYDINEDIAGVHFNSYFVGNELYYDDTLMGMGIFCHEFGHALGLPDFYCTNDSYNKDDPMGNWSIMDSGGYVHDGRAPVGYNAYERSYLGWLDIPELTTEGSVTLTDYDASEGTPAMLIRHSEKEYFILENRQVGTWYPEDMGSGLLLTRFAYDMFEWGGNVLNNTKTKKRAMVITADGKRLSYSGTESNLFGNGKDKIVSLPLYDGTRLNNKPVYAITKNDDRTITFSYLTDPNPTEPAKENIYVKVTDWKQIAPSNRYILVNEKGSVAAAELNGKCLNSVPVLIEGETAIVENDVAIFTLKKHDDGYLLQLADGNYLSAAGDRNLSYQSTETTVWEIASSLDINGFIVENSEYGKIQYNSTVSLFMNYESGSQEPALLYVNTTEQGGSTPDDPQIVDPTDDEVVEGEGIFKRVTDDAQLEANRNYLIVYEESDSKGVAFDGVTEKNIGAPTDVSIADGIIDNTKDGATVVTLLNGGSGRWYLKTADGYLKYNKTEGTRGSNNLFVSDNAADDGTLWTISVANGITNDYNQERRLQYNTASNALRFCCYVGTQKDVTLYKEQPSTTGIARHSTDTSRGEQPVFDLAGRRVQAAGANYLRKGIYIRGGKKFIVK